MTGLPQNRLVLVVRSRPGNVEPGADRNGGPRRRHARGSQFYPLKFTVLVLTCHFWEQDYLRYQVCNVVLA